MKINLRRLVAEILNPPRFTSDYCLACDRQIHNRDHVLQMDGHLVHSNKVCAQIQIQKSVTKNFHLTPRPYLEVIGRCRPGTFK